MAKTAEQILKEWEEKKYATVYFFDGEEDFFIDKLVNFAEEKILTPEEASFNLTVFYGRDSDAATIENACKRYPMFSEKQVVIIKEAQHLKDIEKLENYILKPLESTILIIAFKEKSLDKRKTFSKTIQKNAILFTSPKLKENKITDWISDFVKEKGLKISGKAIALLQEHIGDDLSRISNEIDKLIINIGTKKSIEDDDIEKFIGISKEYNVFELQAAIAERNLAKAIKIIQYFESNPKAANIHSIIPLVFSTFSRVYASYGVKDNGGKSFVFPNDKLIMKNYGYNGVENTILIMHHYNLKSLGIDSAYNTEGTLLREMVGKIIL